MIMKKKVNLLLIISGLTLNCFNQQINSSKPHSYIPFNNVSEEHRDEVNQFLGEMLDCKGLYTLIADIKPMSSMQLKNGFSIYKETILVVNDSNDAITPTVITVQPTTTKKAEYYRNKIRDTVAYYSKVLDEMSDDVFHFQFAPIINYAWTPNDTLKCAKMPNVIVLRKDLALDKIKEKESFFNSIYIDTTCPERHESGSSSYIVQLRTKLLDINYMEIQKDFSWYYYAAMAYLKGLPESSSIFHKERTREIDSTVIIINNANDTLTFPI